MSRGWFSFLILLDVEDDRDQDHEILKKPLDNLSVFIFCSNCLVCGNRFLSAAAVPLRKND